MLQLRHFNPTDTEYEEIVRIYNLEWSDNPSVVTNFKFSDENWNRNHLHQRFVAELDGKLIVEGVYMEPFWAKKPGKFQFGYSMDPAYNRYEEGGRSIHGLVLDYVMAELAGRAPKLLVTGTLENKEERVRFLEESGFVFQMRTPHSALDVTTFEHAKFAHVPAKVAQHGVEMRTLAEMMQDDPNWKQKIYDLCCAIELDVPSPDPPTLEPLSEWEKTFQSPDFVAEAWFVAVDGDQYVGVSMLGLDSTQPKRMYTWLTGVLRSHRRKGVATALKLRAIQLAEERGVETIETGNEENNPMYELNMQMGFRPVPGWVDYGKEL